MKRKFKCYKCGKEDEFDTERGRMQLTEEVQIDPYDVFIVTCKSCGAENRVKIKRETPNE